MDFEDGGGVMADLVEDDGMDIGAIDPLFERKVVGEAAVGVEAVVDEAGADDWSE